MKRNLIFYLYPATGSIWSWHVDQLIHYKNAWNGRKLITVALDHRTDHQAWILQRLKPLEAEVSWVPNEPSLGETAHFIRMLSSVASLNQDEATFYAHAKGVTHNGHRLEAVRRWCEAMYVLNLGSINTVERRLSLFSAVGCFRHYLKHAGSRWHYGGTFFWLKHSAIFSRRWWEIQHTKYGVEAYPGRHLRWGEMGTFTPDDVGPYWLYAGGVTASYIEKWKGLWKANMHTSVMDYLKRMVMPKDVQGKDILEVGSYNVNGTPKVVFMPHAPKSYVGTDQEAGPCVDLVVNATNLVPQLGEGSFDVVLSTEMLEHARDWRAAVNSMKSVVKPGGLLFITTRAPGFPFHGFPEDHWRFTLSDFKKIFADMEIIDLSADSQQPGVLMKARKPLDWKVIDLSSITVAPAPPPPAVRALAPPPMPPSSVGVQAPTPMVVHQGRPVGVSSAVSVGPRSSRTNVVHRRDADVKVPHVKR